MLKEPITFSFKEQDHFGIFLVLTFLLIGGLFVYSATEGTRLDGYAKREFIYILLAIVVFFIALYIPYDIWIDYGYFLYIFIVIILMTLPLFGKSVYGSRSWLSFGAMGFQPSEIAKALTILSLSAYIKDEGTTKFGLREFTILFMIVLIPFILTLIQPDFGTAVTFLSLIPPILFFSNLKLKDILKILGIFSLISIIALGIGWITFLKPYQKERVLTFLNPSRDPKKAGYQVNQSKIAIGSGKFYGKGLHSGTQNRLEFLPAPHTDFIFSVIGEELGFVGSASLIILFYIFLTKLLKISEEAKKREASFLSLATFFLFLFHIGVNIGMCLGIAPTMGIPLPFISYGGSFLITTVFLSGLCLNVSARGR